MVLLVEFIDNFSVLNLDGQDIYKSASAAA